ncbi:MAG: trypsin-like peptidase domain-containing protein [Pirellulaceae bacterium]|nr:trypsin-like peptidase domain-containing protein [Pirellulaceae bacterium]
MAFPKWDGAVYQVHDQANEAVFGTGFVVHQQSLDRERPNLWLVTCAHVVEDCKAGIVIGGEEATVVARGTRHGLDLAVVRVELCRRSVRSLTISGKDFQEQRVEIPGIRSVERQRTILPLQGSLKKWLLLLDPASGSSDIPYWQLHLDRDESVEPDQIEKGYSGSPVLAEDGVCAVLDARRKSAGGDVFKTGTAFPIWHLAKIWPEMPDVLGNSLYGESHWKLHKWLWSLDGARDITWDLVDACREVCGDHPADASLTGCIFTLSRMRRSPCSFLQALARKTNRPAIHDDYPHLGDELPEVGGEVTQEQSYRRLIIRIQERKIPSRGERQRGRRYEVQIHQAQCPLEAGGCCASCLDCAPTATGELTTVWSKSLDQSTKDELADLLRDEIDSVLGVFGACSPDLVQIIAPDSLLAYLVHDARLDQIQPWGSRRLGRWFPTVYSGARRSGLDSKPHGLPQVERGRPWSGKLVRIEDAKNDLELDGKLPEGTVTVITPSRDVAELCVDSPVPTIIVEHDGAEDNADWFQNVGCLYRLPRQLMKRPVDTSLIFDAPQITIQFAQTQQPIAQGL